MGLERELDEVVPVLLKKAGDLSTAGEQYKRDHVVTMFPQPAWLDLASLATDKRAVWCA